MKELHIGKGVDLPISIVTSKAAIMAMTGMGKTYLAKVVAEEMLAAGAQIVVGDYKGEWWGLSSSASGKRAGYNVVVFGGEHADVPMREDAGRAIADVVVNERINAILDVSGFEDDEPKIRFMTDFAYRLFFLNRRPLHFFLDEADEFVPQNPQRGQVRMLGILKRLWQRGRQKGIGGTIISQRPASVHKSLLTQSEILIALRTVGPQDRKALTAWFDAWGTEEQIDEFVTTIASVPEHHAWFWSPKHKLFVMSKARKATTFDSSRTPDVGEITEEPKVRTKHDINRLGKELAAAVEEEKANDPAVLKSQVEALTEEVAGLKVHAAHLELGISKANKARKPGKPYKVKVHVLTQADIKALKRATAANQKVLDTIPMIPRLLADAGHTILAETARLEKVVKAILSVQDEGRALVETGKAIEADVEPFPEVLHVPRPPSPGPMVPPRASGNGGIGPSDGRKRLLIALAQYGSMSASKLRVVAGIASNHTFRKYLGGLKTAGLVSGGGNHVEIMGQGRVELGGDYKALPTGRALVEYWIGELDGGHASLFKVLVSKPTYAFPADELQKASGIQSEHTFRKYLGRLKTLGLAIPMGAHFTSVAPEFKSV